MRSRMNIFSIDNTVALPLARSRPVYPKSNSAAGLRAPLDCSSGHARGGQSFSRFAIAREQPAGSHRTRQSINTALKVSSNDGFAIRAHLNPMAPTYSSPPPANLPNECKQNAGSNSSGSTRERRPMTSIYDWPKPRPRTVRVRTSKR